MSADPTSSEAAETEHLIGRLQSLEKEARAAIVASTLDPATLESARFRYLGRKGELSQLLRALASLSDADRRRVGAEGNRVKDALEAAFAEVEARHTAPKVEAIDVTLPGVQPTVGAIHPLTRMTEEICDIFGTLGFSVADGPEIESTWHNFDALNTKDGHPAREPSDTFYLKGLSQPGSRGGPLLLRTHTSPVQIRTLLAQKPPVRILAPGRVYRHDEVDATHTPVFHQVEGLYVDQGVSFAHLKGTLAAFARALFGAETRTRFRPSFFPFTEPSAEVDVTCVFCSGKGCGVCKHEGFIEVMGAGMVHPEELRDVGLDPEMFSGFAFGMGVERLAQLRWGVKEIRDFFLNDQRLLRGFSV